MNSQNFGPGPTFPPQEQQPSYDLFVRQQPEKARVVVKGKEKDRKPIDPPPILQLMHRTDPTFIHNPYLFCKCWLWHESEHRPATASDTNGVNMSPGELLVGQTVSSLHRLKDLDNTERGFFVFGDLSIAAQGKYRIRFCLWEYNISYNTANYLGEVITRHAFEVTSPKEWDGIRESTVLSRTIADQGIKLRLRKESRHPRGRAIGPSTSSAQSNVSTPIRPNPTATGSYGSIDGQDTGDSIKRQRSSGADSSSGGGGSATATPYAGSIYGGTPNSSGYHSYANQQNLPTNYYPSNYPTSYSNPYANYQFPPNYSVNPATSGGAYSASRTGTSSSSYAQNTYTASAPNQASYGPGYASSSTTGAGASQYMRSGQAYAGQGPDYSHRPSSTNASTPTSAYPNQGYGGSLPSLSATTSTSMSNPGSTPHLAPISSTEAGQGQHQGHAGGHLTGGHPSYAGGYAYASGQGQPGQGHDYK